jgi:hypothetical protein
MNSSHEQAIARLLGEDLYVWSAQPEFGDGRYGTTNGNGYGYGTTNGNGYGCGTGDSDGNGDGGGLSFGNGVGDGYSPTPSN